MSNANLLRVPKGVSALLLRDAQPGSLVNPEAIVTSRQSDFAVAELVVDPDGQAAGIWNPRSGTKGGELARRGYFGFRRAGFAGVLLVHRDHVQRLGAAVK